MASLTTLKSTDLICAGHSDTLSRSINTEFLKLSTNFGLGATANVQDLIKTPWFITAALQSITFKAFTLHSCHVAEDRLWLSRFSPIFHFSGTQMQRFFSPKGICLTQSTSSVSKCYIDSSCFFTKYLDTTAGLCF